MHRLDLNSVVNVTEIPCVVVTDTMDESEILRILKSNGVKGVSGMFISSVDMDFNDFKEVCMRAGIKMTSFESMMDFSEFKLNSDGLIPVIVQDYKTNEVLMMAYMNEEAFDHTVKTGRMTYYSRSRNAQWVKGETSGHFQYVKSLSVDCDKDTYLQKSIKSALPAIQATDPAFIQRSSALIMMQKILFKYLNPYIIRLLTESRIQKRVPIQIICLKKELIKF